MEQDGIVIKEPGTPYKLFIGFSVLLIGACLVGIFTGIDDSYNVFWGIVFLVVATVVLYFSMKGLKEQRILMSISGRGVYLHGKGLYPWSLIESFSTTEELNDGVREKLIFHFSQYEDEEIFITNLEISPKEIVDYLLYYKGTYMTYYAGHRIIE